MTHIKNITRRDFLKMLLGILASNCAAGGFSRTKAFAVPSVAELGYSHEAMFYDKIDDGIVKCALCPHGCVLKDGQRGLCRVREPQNSKLYSLVYELMCSSHIDPIEKKPIYHMLPGSFAFSIATAGCNLRCKFCQNWQISQSPPEETRNSMLSCEKVVALAENNGCKSIAYTYSEPTVFYEYMLDSAKLAKNKNIKNIYVTAGFINPEPLTLLCNYIDAANIDLKAFSDKYLREVCAQRLQPLLEAIKIMHTEGVWIELTNLVVPTLNDDMGMIREMCIWMRENLGNNVPLHFSRFWPMYKLRDLPPTPVETLEKAREIAIKEGLNYVYIGNVSAHEANHTYCPNCKRILIKRAGYYVVENNIRDSACAFCGHKIAGVWN